MKLNIANVLDDINHVHLRYRAGLMTETQLSKELEVLKVKLKAVEIFDVDAKLRHLHAIMKG